MSKGIRSIVLLLAMATVFAAAGCGGGDDQEPVTKAKYVTQANAICGKWQQEREKLFKEFGEKYGNSPNQKQLVAAVSELMEPYEEATAQLAELEPPEGEEAKVDAVVAAMEEGAENVEENPASAITSSASFKKANELTEGYGLKQCMV